MAPFSRFFGLFLLFSPLCGWAAERTLSEVKTGAVIRTTQNVDVPIPPLLKGVLDSDMAFVIAGGHASPLFMAQPKSGPACLVISRKLDFKDPLQFKLPEGAAFVVKSVSLDKKPNPLFAGPGTLIEVETSDRSLQGTFDCYPGKTGKTPISLEAFEGAFGRKIRVELESAPKK